MKKLKIIIFLSLITTTAFSNAKTLEHSHDDRIHAHPLPSSGISHKHGNSQLGRKTQNNNRINTSSVGNTETAEVCKPYTKSFKGKDVKYYVPMPAPRIKQYYQNHYKSGYWRFYPNGDYYALEKGAVKKGKWNTADGHICTWIDNKIHMNRYLASMPSRNHDTAYGIDDDGVVTVGVYTFFPDNDHSFRDKYASQTKFRDKLQATGWRAVKDWDKFSQILSGNTLLMTPTNCPSNISKSECKVIWILDRVGTSKKSGFRDDAKEINLVNKSVTNTEWGKCAGFNYYLCIGSLKARTVTLPKELSKYVFINSANNKFKVMNKKGKSYLFDIVQGHPKQFVQLAKSKNFKKYTANSTGLVQTLISKASQNMIKSMKEPSSTSSGLSRAAWADNLDGEFKTYGYKCNNEIFTIGSSGDGFVSVTGLGDCGGFKANTDISTRAIEACNCYLN